MTSEAQTFAALEQWKNDDAPPLAGVVLETGGTNTPGGTGVANNFSLIAKMNAAGAFNELGSLIVAGGLKPEMVGEVVRTIRPYAVDVSSGVEKVKGKKDRRLIEVFIASVREADAS